MNGQRGKRGIFKIISVMAIVTFLMSACGSGDPANTEAPNTSKTEASSMEDLGAEKSLITLQTDLASVGGWLYVYDLEETDPFLLREETLPLQRGSLPRIVLTKMRLYWILP